MNDDATTPELELASAYLDGDVTESERAQVEASPELMELVDSFEAVRIRLRDTPPPSTTDGLDAAVVAALAEWDSLQPAGTEDATAAALADVSAAAPSNVVPMRRNRWTRVVMSAAAALLIGGVAVTAVNSFGGSSNDSSSAGEPAAEKVADDASGGGAPQTISAINGAASPVPVLDEPSDLEAFAATDASETTAAADAVAAGATETTAAAAETTAAATETVAGDVTSQSVAPAAAPTSRSVVLSFTFDCPLEPTQVVVQEISWQGTPAAVVRDTVSGVIQAVDGECNVLASIQP